MKLRFVKYLAFVMKKHNINMHLFIFFESLQEQMKSRSRSCNEQKPRRTQHLMLVLDACA